MPCNSMNSALSSSSISAISSSARAEIPITPAPSDSQHIAQSVDNILILMDQPYRLLEQGRKALALKLARINHE